jgi:hypothetical protein
MDLKRRIEEFKEMEYEFNKDFYATIKMKLKYFFLFIWSDSFMICCLVIANISSKLKLPNDAS